MENRPVSRKRNISGKGTGLYRRGKADEARNSAEASSVDHMNKGISNNRHGRREPQE